MNAVASIALGGAANGITVEAAAGFAASAAIAGFVAWVSVWARGWAMTAGSPPPHATSAALFRVRRVRRNRDNRFMAISPLQSKASIVAGVAQVAPALCANQSRSNAIRTKFWDVLGVHNRVPKTGDMPKLCSLPVLTASQIKFRIARAVSYSTGSTRATASSLLSLPMGMETLSPPTRSPWRSSSMPAAVTCGVRRCASGRSARRPGWRSGADARRQTLQ